MTAPVNPAFGVSDDSTDFYARVLNVLCISSICVAVPFGIYHFISGDPLVSLVIVPVVMTQASVLYLLRMRGFNLLSALIVATVQLGAATAYVYFLGSAALFWLFASGVANYFILRWPSALFLNGLACVAVVMLLPQEPEFVTRFAISYALVNIFLVTFSLHLERKTKEMAELLRMDPLTGTGNRLALESALKQAKERFDRYGTPVSMLMLDLDHYKQVNDKYGHTAGDRVLKALCDLLQTRLRKTDSLYRFGGEEFVILADNTSAEDARALAEAIRQRVAGATFSPTSGLTVSIGVAELRPAEDSDAWLRRADKALYAAKGSGRNQVSMDRDTSSDTALHDQVGMSSGT